MRPLSTKTKDAIHNDPDYYKFCARRIVFEDHKCDGRITMDHAIIYAGRQLDEAWALVPTCAWAHDVDQFQDGHNYDREKQEYCALIRATDAELWAVSKAIDYRHRRSYLGHKLGVDN